MVFIPALRAPTLSACVSYSCFLSIAGAAFVDALRSQADALGDATQPPAEEVADRFMYLARAAQREHPQLYTLLVRCVSDQPLRSVPLSRLYYLAAAQPDEISCRSAPLFMCPCRWGTCMLGVTDHESRTVTDIWTRRPQSHGRTNTSRTRIMNLPPSFLSSRMM